MNRIAVDVALLPNEAMTTQVIDANANLVAPCDSRIVLDSKTCLPHVSLAMGCIERDAVDRIRQLLDRIKGDHPVGELVVTGVVTTLNVRGERVSVFAVAKTKALQMLHEQIMDRLQPDFSRDVTEAMIYGDAPVAETTLAWIRDFREKAAYAAFFPHITIGYGAVEQVMSFPVLFRTSKLALCHLGNHCTCRKVLASVTL